MSEDTLLIRVYGVPGPQGSKSFKGLSKKTGKAIMVESSKKVKPWRDDVIRDAVADVGSPMWEGPVVVEIDFYLPRPPSVSKRRRVPWVKPDLSKLVRSTEDALRDAGVFKDDAQIVSINADKHYADTEAPGALIHILRGEPDAEQTRRSKPSKSLQRSPIRG